MQLSERDSLAAHRGEVVLVFIVTATGLLNTRFWEEDLREQVDGVTYLRVADIPEHPPVSIEREQMRRDYRSLAQQGTDRVRNGFSNGHHGKPQVSVDGSA